MSEPRPPSAAAPALSIVLVVGDGWDATFETLIAIARSTGGLGCETIVVDDGSTDETSLALPHLEGVQVVRNERPAGVESALDQGAARARGTWIAFFRSGQPPAPGGLQSLLQVAASATGAGAVLPSAAALPRLPEGAIFAATPLRRAGGFSKGGAATLAGRLQAAGHHLVDASGATLAPVAGTSPQPPRPRSPRDPKAPLISIVVPFHGRSGWLAETIRSALAQTYQHWELLLVDDGWPGDVRAEVDLSDPRIRYLRQENRGVAAARNHGLEAAEGEFIAFLDSDDRWAPEKLERQLAQLTKHPQALISHTSYARIDALGKPLDVANAGRFSGRVYPGIFLECPIATPTVMIRRAVVDSGHRFHEGSTVGEDLLFWAGVTRDSELLGLDLPLCEVRMHGNNHAFETASRVRAIVGFVRKGLDERSGLSLQDRGRVATALYSNMAKLCHADGDLPGFLAASTMAYLAPVTPADQGEAAAAALADLLATVDLPALLLGKEGRLPPGAPPSVEALTRLFATPHQQAYDAQRRRATASAEPVPPRVEALASPPLVTVLVPSYNQAHFLPETLDTLLAQTYPHWEAVVVNDGSTDDTPAVLAGYAARDPRFRVFNKANGGVSTALNEGIRQARGEWICWLSSDDLYQADKLALQVDAILANPGVRFHHSNYLILDERRRSVGETVPNPRTIVPPRELQVIELLGENYVNGITVALHRTIFDEVGTFDDQLRQGQDYDLWLRLSARFPSAYLDKPTSLFRVHPGQGSSLFRAANVFDSGRAGLKFLNAHPFEALFPLLDLTRPDEAARALTAAVKVAANASAYLTFSGYAPALVDRLTEWITTRCPAARRPAAQRHYQELLRVVQASSLPPWVKAAFQPRAGPQGDATYQPRDPLVELERHGEVLRAAGQVQSVHDVSRYLLKVRGG